MLSMAALLYGLIGVFRLGVTIDLFPIAGAVGVWIVATASHRRRPELLRGLA